MRQKRYSSFYQLPGLLIGIGTGLVFSGYNVNDIVPVNFVSSVVSTAGGGCNIKGNISIDTGERIYHVLGQQYYSQTKISPQYGERWFCSEAEARAAGWRRSRV